MKYLALVILFTALSFTTANAHEQKEYTGKYLLETCNVNNGTLTAECTAYLEGAIAGLKMGIMLSGGPDANMKDITGICPTADTNTEKLRLVVSTWLEDHPNKQKLPAVLAAYGAIKDAFPCDD